MSHFGPLTRTVGDAALALDVLAGADERDPASWGRPWAERGPSFSAAAEQTPGPLRIAVIDSVDDYPVDAEVKEALGATANLLSGLGHRLEPVTWQTGAYRWLSVILASCAAADLRARDRAVAVDDGLARVAEWGARRSAADLTEAMAGRAAFAEHIRFAMDGYDLALLPTAPVLPFTAGADSPEGGLPGSFLPDGTLDPACWLAWCSFCYVGNLTGYPAVSLPLGISSDGLPIGIQLMGRWRQDATVLAAARQIEIAAPWAGRLRQLHERSGRIPHHDG